MPANTAFHPFTSPLRLHQEHALYAPAPDVHTAAEGRPAPQARKLRHLFLHGKALIYSQPRTL